MKAAGEEECKLAIESNQFHEGVAAIRVILDGGWSKRSHRHPLWGACVVIPTPSISNNSWVIICGLHPIVTLHSR